MASIGYTEGATVEIATHRLTDIGGKEHHLQRLAPGAGIVEMIPATGAVWNTSLAASAYVGPFDCKAAGRITVFPMISATGILEISLILLDGRGVPMGRTPASSSDFATLPTQTPTAHGITPVWTATESITVGAMRCNGTNQTLFCTTAGVTGGTTPTISGAPGDSVVDGTVTWMYIGYVAIALMGLAAVFTNTMGASKYLIYIKNTNAKSFGLMHGVL